MIFGIYERYWKVWLLIPTAMLIVSIAILANNFLSTGYILQRDVELSGGKIMTFEVSGTPDLAKISSLMPEASVHLTQGATSALLVQVPFDADENKVIEKLSGTVKIIGAPTIKSVGPILGDLFWKQTQTAVIAAFALMAIFVFILFRSPAPSSIVLLAATTDIVATLAILSILGIKLSLPIIAALLMIIGYSVDTDILLTSALLKARKEEMQHKLKTTIKTGLTMSFTTAAALIAILLISGSPVLEQIALVLLIGVLVDIPATWLGNAGWLRLWLLRHE